MSGIRPVYGRSAAIVCGHPSAAAAGWEALARGGSVADAAIAAASVLAVVLPQACTLGGDAFILLHEAQSGRTFGLNASGRSPARTSPAALDAAKLERGVLSCATPGVVAGWEALHSRFGRLPWRDLLARAIELADRGFPASPGLAAATATYRVLLEQDPGATQLFLRNGPLKPGMLFRQPQLAATLDGLAHGGAQAFYRGAAAASVARYVRSRGGWLDADDFAGCAADWVDPIEAGYRGLRVRVMPPNAYGLFMLLQLIALDDIDLANVKANAPERYAALIAAAHTAFAAGDKHVADPSVAAPLDTILSDRGIAAVRADFRKRLGRAPSNRGGTAVVAITDEHGNGAAVVQSVFLVFGSGVADPDSGILLNDRMLGFNLAAGHPNAVAPSKRPAHTLNPVMTFDRGALRHVLLTPGGPGQTLTLTQVLQAAVDHGLPLHEAVALPRWSMDLGGNTIVEPELPDAPLEGLKALGVTAARGAKGAPFFGSAECVERLPGGGVLAVADDRREAHAIAV
jgi:gamma-glutamyltranspeptidase